MSSLLRPGTVAVAGSSHVPSSLAQKELEPDSVVVYPSHGVLPSSIHKKDVCVLRKVCLASYESGLGLSLLQPASVPA